MWFHAGRLYLDLSFSHSIPKTSVHHYVWQALHAIHNSSIRSLENIKIFHRYHITISIDLNFNVITKKLQARKIFSISWMLANSSLSWILSCFLRWRVLLQGVSLNNILLTNNLNKWFTTSVTARGFVLPSSSILISLNGSIN